ncbi:MAG TPA: type II secretion system protein GspM [Gallionellaceae bacterium]|nr:type II secretion system protein GspM [Gallionellaceae bacterium]
MIRQAWEKFSSKVGAMSLRERALVFVAAAFLLISLINTFLFDPLLLKQKNLSSQVVQQQEKMKEIQAQIEAIQQARGMQDQSPQRQQLGSLLQELAEGDAYLSSNREKLVPPEKMADLLRQVLEKNANLQLLSLQTLPVTPLLENENAATKSGVATTTSAAAAQIFKHGVVITVRGNYLDLLQYLAALERLPTQMFWGKAKMEVVQHPAAELTLTLYTLSLDKTWLQV